MQTLIGPNGLVLAYDPTPDSDARCHLGFTSTCGVWEHADDTACPDCGRLNGAHSYHCATSWGWDPR